MHIAFVTAPTIWVLNAYASSACYNVAMITFIYKEQLFDPRSYHFYNMILLVKFVAPGGPFLTTEPLFEQT